MIHLDKKRGYTFREIAKKVKSRSESQVRSHNQKFEVKANKDEERVVFMDNGRAAL